VLKVTLPSPSLFANFWDPERAPTEYRSLEDFLADVAEVIREEADELAGMGATYLQLDAPHYTMVLDPRTFGIHLCRGNQASRWLVEGGYEAVAEQIFGRIHARRLLLEYDDPRSGGFQPLLRVPTDRWVVLGLVTTKQPRLESVDDTARRIEAASRYVSLERLAVSPQCGFATSVLGNALTIDDERAKLRLVAEAARKIWG
jgi:5-methyltetrahydropteroyltriglutamate--homocysteine methyltransferase